MSDRTYTRLSADRIRIRENVGTCERCGGRGEVYVHDPSADGHGGMNGGAWVYLRCSQCHGRGTSDDWEFADYERIRRPKKK